MTVQEMFSDAGVYIQDNWLFSLIILAVVIYAGVQIGKNVAKWYNNYLYGKEEETKVPATQPHQDMAEYCNQYLLSPPRYTPKTFDAIEELRVKRMYVYEQLQAKKQEIQEKQDYFKLVSDEDAKLRIEVSLLVEQIKMYDAQLMRVGQNGTTRTS